MCVCDLVFLHVVAVSVAAYPSVSCASTPVLPNDDEVCVLGPADLQACDWCAQMPVPPAEQAGEGGPTEGVPGQPIPVADEKAARTAI
eukprot:2404611-Alexandrium_andersonii.AAC.1